MTLKMEWTNKNELNAMDLAYINHATPLMYIL